MNAERVDAIPKELQPDIRPAVAGDWYRIYPFYSAIVEGGDTYAFPLGQSPRPWWMEEPPGLRSWRSTGTRSSAPRRWVRTDPTGVRMSTAESAST